MRGMFYNCTDLKYLDLSNFNTTSTEFINYFFYAASSLIYIKFNSLTLKSNTKLTLSETA